VVSGRGAARYVRTHHQPARPPRRKNRDDGSVQPAEKVPVTGAALCVSGGGCAFAEGLGREDCRVADANRSYRGRRWTRRTVRTVRRCEEAGVSLLCCPEAAIGGLADYCAEPERLAIATADVDATFAPIASNRVTAIVGFTERGEGWPALQRRSGRAPGRHR
jgi:hypothetical protein